VTQVVVERPEEVASVVESVVIQGDLARLQPGERVTYYRSVCESLGLNPLTKPFEYLMLNNRLTLYARKDATDQLRASRGISVEISAREFLQDAGLYVVTAKAVGKDGRTDESVGAVNVKGLQGENLANALMKAETKAKRRVTLSVAGLGWLDETEVAAVADGRPVAVDPETGEVLERSHRPAPPIAARDSGGRVNWSAFWAEAKRLGFDQKSVYGLAGTSSLAHLDREAIEDLLSLMRDKAEIAAAETLPPEDER
jgi:hypothetical protein